MKFLQLEEENIEELSALDTLNAGELFTEKGLSLFPQNPNDVVFTA